VGSIGGCLKSKYLTKNPQGVLEVFKCRRWDWGRRSILKYVTEPEYRKQRSSWALMRHRLMHVELLWSSHSDPERVAHKWYRLDGFTQIEYKFFERSGRSLDFFLLHFFASRQKNEEEKFKLKDKYFIIW